MEYSSLPDSKTFCVLPWIHLVFGFNEQIKPCCKFQASNFPQAQSKSLSEVFDGPIFHNIREKMLAGEKIDGCWKCYEAEKVNQKSMREIANSDFKKIWSETPKIKYLELMLDNVCNLKCRSCSSGYSTSWYQDEVELGRAPTWNRLFTQDISKLSQEGVFNHLTKIKIMGGEPFLSPSHGDLLKSLDHLERLPKMHLEYNTNATMKVSQQVLTYWSKLSAISIDFSLDGYKHKNDFFREGSSWENVISNIHWFIENVRCKQVFFSIHTVVSVYNLNDIIMIDDWLEAEFPGLMLTKGVAVFPSWLDIRNFPEDQKQKALSLYKKIISENKISESRAGFYRLIQQFLEKPQQISFEEFVKMDKKLNEIRKRKLEDYDPELARFLNLYRE